MCVCVPPPPEISASRSGVDPHGLKISTAATAGGGFTPPLPPPWVGGGGGGGVDPPPRKPLPPPWGGIPRPMSRLPGNLFYGQFTKSCWKFVGTL